MMRIFKTRSFGRWMHKSGITDDMLADATIEMTRGLVDARLGGHIAKKRIGLSGEGKRGGARVLVATNHEGSWFFLYG